MDSDKLLVMDAGKIVEFGHPYNLLKNEDGYLFKMAKHCRHDTAGLFQNKAL